SVQMNLPWVRNIIIVAADGQRPAWLPTDTSRVVVVPHSKIMPAEHLPTFNSNAIESNLVNIPGLSKRWVLGITNAATDEFRFLYLNDDYFIGRPMSKADFFPDEERHYVFLDREKSGALADVRASALTYSNSYINSVSPSQKNQRRADSHAASPMDLSALKSMYELKGREWEITSSHRFRSSDDLTLVFVYNHFVLENPDHLIGRLPWFLWKWTQVMDFGLTDNLIWDQLLLRVMEYYRPQLFCINDDVTSADDLIDIQRVVKGTLERIFPESQSHW
ncbi:hypothetical protein PROFUN_02937, partial [Planoprotostelium fungivorum]